MENKNRRNASISTNVIHHLQKDKEIEKFHRRHLNEMKDKERNRVLPSLFRF